MVNSIPINNVHKEMHPLLLPHIDIYNGNSTRRKSESAARTPSLSSEITSDALILVAPRSSNWTSRINSNLNLNINCTTSNYIYNQSYHYEKDSLSSVWKAEENDSKNLIRKDIGDINFIQLNLKRKRQRIGPSCDTCRSRKVKCDAKVEILYQCDRIVKSISNKLNIFLTRSQIKRLPKIILKHIDIPTDLLNNSKGDNYYKLLKHNDKIVLFHPCSSCIKLNKKKGGKTKNIKRLSKRIISKEDNYCCCFSKGLTRADINVFSKIEKNTSKQNIFDMTVQDLENAMPI